MTGLPKAITAFAVIAMLYATPVRVCTAAAASGRTVPDEAQPFIPPAGVVIAYAEFEAQQGEKTMAMAIRTPRPNQPADIDPWDADYTCDLIVLRKEGGRMRVSGRSNRAVACRGNLLNPNVGTRVLDSSLELKEDEVTFENLGDTAFKGTTTYSFRCAGGTWHLSAAKSVYSSYRRGGGVAHKEESISYPKDFGLITMEDFDPDMIKHVMARSERIIE